jgi:hypothetical protein
LRLRWWGCVVSGEQGSQPLETDWFSRLPMWACMSVVWAFFIDR